MSDAFEKAIADAQWYVSQYPSNRKTPKAAEADNDMTIAVTESKGKRKPTLIRKLAAVKQAAPVVDTEARANKWIAWATKNNVDMAAVLAEMGLATIHEATEAHWVELQAYAKNLAKKAT